MRPRRALCTAIALSVIGLATLSATAAWANPTRTSQGETTIALKSAHTNQLASSTAFGKGCDQIPGGDRMAGRDGWVFVLPGDVGGRFTELTITFRTTDGQQVQITIEDVTAPFPNGIVDGQGDNKAFAVTPAGWTIVRGEAQVTGAKTGRGGTADFNVTHTCVASGDNGDTGDNGGSGGSGGSGSGTGHGGSSSSPPASGGGSPSAAASPAGGTTLPVTGTSLGMLITTAIALVGAGVALLTLRRRRNRLTFTA